MAYPDFVEAYQWNFRPQNPTRPEWFKEWPGGARMAVMLILLHEWMSVPEIARPMPKGSHYPFDSLALGGREYGARFGVWRLLDVLDRHHIKATVVTSGLVAELFPESVREVQKRGHEVATHGWDQSIHPPVFKTKDEERNSIAKSVAALEEAAKQRIVGYMSPGPRPTPNTLELCAEQGFVWTADYSDSDVPYIINVNGKKLVSVGYVMPNYTDNDLVPLGLESGLKQLQQAFNASYEESRRHPMKFCYACHVHISGRPGMSRLLDQFIDYVQRHDGVQFYPCIDIANFWLEGEGNSRSRV
jgi:peptidoglycan/xylan/chitin deacetylase (PgdA/CDA1 family)